MKRRLLALISALLLLAAPAMAAPLRVVGFMTDFDVKDDAVAICKAVMDQVAPGVRILDITHAVEPYNIAQAARFLAGTAPYLPADAVMVVVVDPGVGSARKAIIAKSRRGQFFVLPDNGLLTLIQDADGLVGAREITNPAWMIGARRSSTFHGRDIFSPAAAHLARGDDWTQAGPAVDVAKLVRLDLKAATLDAAGARAEAIGTDGPYGNLILNLTGEQFATLGYALGETVTLQVDGKPHTIPFVRTFSDVPVGKELLYVDSRGRISLGINEANFAEMFKAAEGAKVVIPRKASAGR
ncbi:MAG: SAM hydrolase/SAM-dependent halogenase family protein [Phenylobacterium sp.]